VQHSENVVIVYCCPELADLGEFVVVLQSTMDILGTVSSTGLSGEQDRHQPISCPSRSGVDPSPQVVTTGHPPASVIAENSIRLPEVPIVKELTLKGSYCLNVDFSVNSIGFLYRGRAGRVRLQAVRARRI
jgi:hypothetical protein